MRILSSSVALTSSVATSVAEVRRERALLWAGDPPPQGGADAARATRAIPATPAVPAHGDGPAIPAVPATPAVPASSAAPKGAGAGEATPADVGDGLDPRDELRLFLLLRLLGIQDPRRAEHAIRQAYADGASQAAVASAELSRAEATASPAAAPTRAGWGLEVDISVARTEATSVAFSAAARVTTADGRTIDTAATLEMERVATSVSEVEIRAGDRRRTAQDPLAVNLTGAPVAFDGTQSLDLDGDGEVEQVAQLASGSAWLARDLDGSGAVESGAELFGPGSGDGFGELAALDEDGNGWVDEGDRAFADLALWDGKQLTSLSAARIGALYTGAAGTAIEVSGTDGAVAGQVQKTGIYLREDGTAGTVQHVDLVVT